MAAAVEDKDAVAAAEEDKEFRCKLNFSIKENCQAVKYVICQFFHYCCHAYIQKNYSIMLKTRKKTTKATQKKEKLLMQKKVTPKKV